MSYRPSVIDSSRDTPYFYTRNSFPIKTHRTTYFDIAQSSLVSRKFGNYKPFWAKGLDKVSRGYQVYKRYSKKIPYIRKRYVPFYPWFANETSKFVPKTSKKRNTKFQKGVVGRRSFQSSNQSRSYFSRRRRFRSCRTNKCCRCTGSYRFRNQIHRNSSSYY